MTPSSLSSSLITALILSSSTDAFITGSGRSPNMMKNKHAFFVRNVSPLRFSSSMGEESASTTIEDDDALNLTPELEKMTNGFAMFGDEKMRYKQLMLLANKLPPVDDSVRIPGNKVQGCLSTVYVDCSIVEEEGNSDKKLINFVGDSDGVLTKGLVALLVRGLSGHTAEEINKVNPKFIHVAKISQSLTPGRNNGFLNMVSTMKRKAIEISESSSMDNESTQNDQTAEQQEDDSNQTIITSFDEVEGKPIYNAIMSSLITALKPTDIQLLDESESGEGHFSLTVVADAFDGLSPEKRQQLISLLLMDVMSEIDALEINAMTPSEV